MTRPVRPRGRTSWVAMRRAISPALIGWTMAFRSARARGSAKTIAPRALSGRSPRPRRRCRRPKRATHRLSAAPPGANSSWTMRSASTWKAPSSRKNAATVLFPDARPAGQSRFEHRRAASRCSRGSIAIVIGPTPPGTGDSQPARGLRLRSVRTSPHSTEPLSRSARAWRRPCRTARARAPRRSARESRRPPPTAPGLMNSAGTNPGCPIAATRMSASAATVGEPFASGSARSSPCSSREGAGSPSACRTMLLRPSTTARFRRAGSPLRFRSAITPTRSARTNAGEPRSSRPALRGMEPVDVLRRVDRPENPVLGIDAGRQRELHEDRRARAWSAFKVRTVLQDRRSPAVAEGEGSRTAHPRGARGLSLPRT